MDSLLIQNKLSTTPKKGSGKPDIIIIGAGFSKSFGVPLANELLKNIKVNYKKTFPSVRFIDDFITDFYPDTNSLSEYPDIEDFLAMLETAEAYSHIRNNNRGYFWRPFIINNMKSTINKCIGDFLWGYQSNIDNELVNSVEKLLNRIGSNPVFISFNYDLLLETALTKLGRKFVYGLSNDFKYISIIKPHGSINWFPLNTFSDIKCLNIGQNIQVPITLTKKDIKFRKWHESYIIIPSPVKKIELFEMKKMWTAFTSSISIAKSLTIIGYSLPYSDKLSRHVIRRAGPIFDNCSDILIIDPCSRVIDVYQKYVSKRAQLFCGTFLDWISKDSI